MNTQQLIKFLSTCLEEDVFKYCQLMVKQHQINEQLKYLLNTNTSVSN